ncbi:MAG: histidine phosphatase family protein [Syntrophobacteraceae bacterium]
MSVFLLIRHADNPAVGKRLTGTLPGVHLNEEGKAQAEILAERLARISIDAIYCSPLERAFETALPLAGRLGLEIRTNEKLSEVDFGDWSGLDFHHLADDPLWRHCNTFRTGTRPPNGELVVEVQQRMVTEIERLRKEYPHGTLAVISHADPIKSVLAHYAGIPLDFFPRLEISLASVSILSISDYGARVLCMNCLGEIPDFLLSL